MPFDWTHWSPATCYPAACFCEGIRSGWLRQPANSLSSLLFLLPALWLLRPNRAPRHPLAAPFAVALVVIGLGSALFHTSLSFVGQTFDVLGMYLLVTMIAASAATRLGWLSVPAARRWYLAANLALLVGLVLAPSLRRYLFAILALGASTLEWRASRAKTPRRYLATAIATLALGFAVWVLDITKTWCDPLSLVQGHAIWHATSALAAGLYIQHALAPPLVDGESHR